MVTINSQLAGFSQSVTVCGSAGSVRVEGGQVSRLKGRLYYFGSILLGADLHDLVMFRCEAVRTVVARRRCCTVSPARRSRRTAPSYLVYTGEACWGSYHSWG